ncbi:hypothetical protein PTTG_28156 [Puccinia triticina 1-1 BBBD Race 1]|uniref:Uncharacterized protein n=1 Tax=Puccinia triticina (isolate 1-1 / race 1 (BBBD)) TaxID=630390 RepID=A0A180GG42_PUCT1|nr:hypothetical protein PTTG_28156 [Puccinia triticina 1-1 BBBD Race 1]
MSIWAMRLSHICLLIVVLLGSIGISTCFLKSEDILQCDAVNWCCISEGREGMWRNDDLVDKDEIDSAKIIVSSINLAATKALNKGKESPDLREIGWKITGKCSPIFKADSEKEQSINLAKRYSKEIEGYFNLCRIEATKISLNKNSWRKLDDLLEYMRYSALNIILGNCSQEEPENMALKFVKKFQEVWRILNTKPDISEPSLSPGKYLIMFMLNDTLVEFLIASEKLNLISFSCLHKILNEKIEGHIIFNYIWGKFPPGMDITGAYLNYNFQRSIEESPFTENLSGLLKCQ